MPYGACDEWFIGALGGAYGLIANFFSIWNAEDNGLVMVRFPKAVAI